MRTPSPPPEEIQHGLATLYDNTFPTQKEYREFTVNCLTMWGNTLDYKLFDTLYMTHQYHSCTIKRLREQAMALLEEANKINERNVMNITFLLFFFDMHLPYAFHFTYLNMSLPAGVHESPNTCATCACLTVNTSFPPV
jgi:hypothetical protein